MFGVGDEGGTDKWRQDVQSEHRQGENRRLDAVRGIKKRRQNKGDRHKPHDAQTESRPRKTPDTKADEERDAKNNRLYSR